MRYKYIKIIQSKMCDETIEEKDTKIELIKKIIESKLNCSLSVNQGGITKKFKKVKLVSMSDSIINILIQEKSGSFKTCFNLEEITDIEVVSFSDIISIDNENNRYQFLEI